MIQIGNVNYEIQDVSRALTVPDCNVVALNKIGDGHGEAKFYFGSRPELEQFFGNNDRIECFFLRADLLEYMQMAQREYEFPTQHYTGEQQLRALWRDRVNYIQTLPEIIPFHVEYQRHLQGGRGYINSNDEGYQLFRQLSLPLISYISIMRLQAPTGRTVDYWKLFVDFDAIEQNRAIGQVLTYGGRNRAATPAEQPAATAAEQPAATPAEQPAATAIETEQRTGRDAAAQAQYRRLLLEECPFCPITRIADERLLIASHIKPLRDSNEEEAYDPKNGYMLSPLYDKLFDQGFISFDSDRRLIVSNWLSPSNQERCRLNNGEFIQLLPMDERREFYLTYHRQFVFKG